MRNRLRWAGIILVIIITTLSACTTEQELTVLNPSPELINNQQLEGLVAIEIEFEAEVVVVGISNQTNTSFALDSPILEYFDVDKWFIIPGEPHTLDEKVIWTNDTYTFEVSQTLLERQETGLFRFRVRVFDRRNYNPIHDLVYEFEIE